MWGYSYSPDNELENLMRYKRILELRYRMIESEIKFLEERIKLLRELMKESGNVYEPGYMYKPMAPWMYQPQYQPVPPYSPVPYQGPSYTPSEALKLEGRHRIVVATQGPRGLDDIVSPMFARAPFFTLIDVEDGEIKNVETIENRFSMMPGGAGMAVAEYMKELNAEIVVAGSFGPNSSNILQGMGIKILTMPPAQVREVMKRLGLNL